MRDTDTRLPGLLNGNHRQGCDLLRFGANDVVSPQENAARNALYVLDMGMNLIANGKRPITDGYWFGYLESTG